MFFETAVYFVIAAIPLTFFVYFHRKEHRGKYIISDIILATIACLSFAISLSIRIDIPSNSQNTPIDIRQSFFSSANATGEKGTPSQRGKLKQALNDLCTALKDGDEEARRATKIREAIIPLQAFVGIPPVCNHSNTIAHIVRGGNIPWKDIQTMYTQFCKDQ